MRLRGGHWAWVAFAVGPVALLAALVVKAATQAIAGLDTVTMLHGVARAEECVRAGKLTGCDVYTNISFGTVGPFSPLQYIPGYAFKVAGLSFDGALTGLAILSALSFAATFALMSFVAAKRAGAAVGALVGLAVLCGPLPWYATTGLGETLAALAIAGFVASLLLPLPAALIALAAFAAGITKDTAAPFLILIAFAAFRVRDVHAPGVRSRAIGAAAGIVAALAANGAWNVFRYGSPLNEFYLQAPFRVPDAETRAEFFTALWVAPNGGLVWFWLPAIALLLAFAVTHARRGRRIDQWIPPVILAAVAAGLSSWWAPFGWEAWGPRLMVAWVPGLLLLSVWLAPRDQARAIAMRLLGSSRRAAAVATVAVVTALPTAGIIGDPARLPQWFFPPCENVEVLPDAYYDCHSRRAWGDSLLLLEGAGGIGTADGAGLALLFGLAAASLAAAGARSLRRPPHDPNVLPDGLPAPGDDGAAAHLPGWELPEMELAATDGSSVSLARVERAVVFAYPRTGVPGEEPLTPDWDLIPGARGCTPETCAFRDHHAELLAAGAGAVYGLSTQDTEYQREAAERLHLPFPLLSDAGLELTHSMRLPVFEVAGQTLMKRFTLVIRGGEVEHVFYPVFPPDRHAEEVLEWLR